MKAYPISKFSFECPIFRQPISGPKQLILLWIGAAITIGQIREANSYYSKISERPFTGGNC